MEITFINEHPNIYKKIVSEVDKHDALISCSDRVINKIIRKINRYIKEDESRAQHKYVLYRIITKEIAQAYKEKKKEHEVVPIHNLLHNDFGESLEYEPVDALASVEEPLLEKSSLNEKIRSLAATDSEKFVLNAWIEDKDRPDTDIARELALRFGGNSRSLRIWVQRFRTKCQERLEKECLAKNLLIKTA